LVNVAERLVALLEHAGVDVIFGVGGTHSLQLLGALERRSTVRFVAARNEQGAAYMAVGYARATRKVGVVLTSTGPGALNALSGIADAEYSSLPVLHITTWADHGTYSGGIHESPFQSDVMAGVGDGVEQVVDGDVDTPFRAAWDRCSGSTPRPVTLEIYSKAWNAEVDAAGESAPVPAVGSSGRSVPAAEAEMLDRFAAVLDGAQQPVIYAGGGVIRSGASAKLMELAEALGAPVVTSYQGPRRGHVGPPTVSRRLGRRARGPGPPGVERRDPGRRLEALRVVDEPLDPPAARAGRVRSDVTIVLDGQRFEASAEYGEGDPFSPETTLSDADLDAKCHRFLSVRRPEIAARLAETIWKLPELGVREFVAALYA
jgi:hypothetical protein